MDQAEVISPSAADKMTQENFPLVAANPVCTGLTMFRFDVAVQQAELRLCNMTESIMALAHVSEGPHTDLCETFAVLLYG